MREAQKTPGGLTLDRFPVNFDFAHVYPAARTVTAAGHEVHEAKFIDLAQVGIGDKGRRGSQRSANTNGNHPLRVRPSANRVSDADRQESTHPQRPLK